MRHVEGRLGWPPASANSDRSTSSETEIGVTRRADAPGPPWESEENPGSSFGSGRIAGVPRSLRRVNKPSKSMVAECLLTRACPVASEIPGSVTAEVTNFLREAWWPFRRFPNSRGPGVVARMRLKPQRTKRATAGRIQIAGKCQLLRTDGATQRARRQARCRVRLGAPRIRNFGWRHLLASRTQDAP